MERLEGVEASRGEGEAGDNGVPKSMMTPAGAGEAAARAAGALALSI